MATRRQIRSDIILRLTKGKPSDDFEVDPRQVDFWIDSVKSALVAEKLEKDAMYGIESYITSFDDIEIKTEAIKGNDVGVNDKRRYSDLPGDVLSLGNDVGVYFVETMGGTEIHRMKPSDKKRFSLLKFGKPSKKNITYFRVNDKLVYQGGNSNLMDNGKVSMLLVLSNTLGVIGDDDVYPLPGDMIPILIEQAEVIGRRELELPQDLNNDGEQL